VHVGINDSDQLSATRGNALDLQVAACRAHRRRLTHPGLSQDVAKSGLARSPEAGARCLASHPLELEFSLRSRRLPRGLVRGDEYGVYPRASTPPAARPQPTGASREHEVKSPILTA
jgi:hypothetical protein